MPLSSLSSWNGLLIHNNNLSLDPATIICNNSDWSIQFFYKGTTAGTSYLFYVGNDAGNSKYLGVKSLIGTGELQLFFTTALPSTITTFNTGIYATGSFKSYTFVKQGYAFYIYQGHITPFNLTNNLAFVYSNLSAFTTAVYPSSTDYLSIGGNSPGNSTTSTNFISFYKTALTNGFVKDYYRLVYETDAPNLLCNIRGDVDYTSNNIIVERDLNSSFINLTDVCT